MKGLFTLLTLTILVLPVLGQLTPAQQKQLDDAKKKLEQLQKDPAYQAKIQQAQQAMNRVKTDTSLQHKVDQAGSQLKGVQQDHPEAAGIQMPNMGDMSVPNLDAINQQLNTGTQMMSSYMGALNQTMPKQDPLHHAEKLPVLTPVTIKALAQGILKQVLPKIDPFKKTALKTRFDSCRNLAGLGAFLLANGASTNETMYIICNAILKNPADIWSVNNLGVYFRDVLQYEPALQCYLYANRLDSGQSSVLDVNIAWASLYYGDFDAAGKYFGKALAIDQYFLSALEGQALMAFQRGDLGALFKCMTKELEVTMRQTKDVQFGDFGSQPQPPEPSDEFADMTASAYIRSVGNLEEQSDPTEDHSLDNLAGDEPDQGTPPGADEEDVTYPEYRTIFVGSAEQLRQTQPACVKFMQGSQSILTTLHKNLTAQLSGLKPLVATTETDGKGTLTVDKSYRRYVDLIAEARRLFDRRIYWFVKQYLKDFTPYPMQMFNRAQDMQKAYLEELKGCPVNDPQHTACVNRINCEWKPKMVTSCNSDIESVTRIWNKYWGSVHSTIQWYINVTGPLISRIHDVGWNEYVNQERIVDVRTAVLQSYNNWASAVMRIPVPILVGVPIATCRIDINGMDPPDPFSQKPKKIHEFQGPCYDHDYPMGGIGGIQETCHSTKYYIGVGDNKLFWETVKDPLYAQDNNYANKVGGTVGVSKLLGVEKEDEGSGLKFAAGINVKAEGSIWGQWDANGQFTGAGSSVGASAEASAEISKGNIKIGGSQSVGVDATSTYKVVAGQLQTGPPVISVTH